jgi:hypothetical protein
MLDWGAAGYMLRMYDRPRAPLRVKGAFVSLRG